MLQSASSQRPTHGTARPDDRSTPSGSESSDHDAGHHAAAHGVSSGDRASADRLRTLLRTAQARVNAIVLGKPTQVHLTLVALLARGHVLLDDTPGVGKTTLARTLAAVLGLDVRRVQFTPDLMPADIVGLSLPAAVARPDGVSAAVSPMVFHPGPIFAQMVLADEINRASPRTQSALLEAMAERQVSVDGVTHALPEPFLVVATQNPADSSGTFPLPESQLDRFLFRLSMDYPDEAHEIALLMGQGGLGVDTTVAAVLTADDVFAAQHAVDRIGVSHDLARYVRRLLDASRRQAGVAVGLSPRAGLALVQAARAHAFLAGRAAVLPEDIHAVFVHATAHRLTMNGTTGNAEQTRAAQALCDSVPVV